MREAAYLILSGLVAGWGTSCEDPSSGPHSRVNVTVERPFVCPVDDCQHSYRRKDHLARHLLQHEGKMFSCPVDHCGRQFTLLGNMQRHVREVHDDDDDSCSSDGQSQSQHHHVCPESGCGKSFRYQSRLKKHMGIHVNLEYVDVICCEPGCMQHFTNAECLKAHIQTSHRHNECPICGTKQLRKNIKRHMRTHEKETTSERIKCPFPRCLHTFSRKSNLTKHIRAVHEELRPFICRFPGCGQRFPYKHVRDNHEKSGVHTYVEGDFLVSDEQFLARSRGRKKREQPPPVGSLLRKRIAATPEEDSTHRLRRLLESLG